ncbi:MAG: DUF2147 domain-containing protein [Pseudomonadota bacterium]
MTRFAAFGLILTLLLPFGAHASADEGAQGPYGLWLTEKRKVAINLAPCGEEMCGEIVWLAKPYTKSGILKRDVENPDPALRDRPWCGITVITGLRQKKAGVWKSGEFYFPKDGRRYDLEIKQVGDQLKVYAFLGVKLLGKSEKWSRADPEKIGCVEAS